MCDIDVFIENVEPTNENYITVNNKKIKFDDIRNIKIKYRDMIITIHDKNQFNLVEEYDNVRKTLKKQKICPNEMKRCKGCLNEVLYICSSYCTIKDEYKIELIKHALSNNIKLNDSCCKSNNALIFSIKNRSLELSRFFLERKISPNSLNDRKESPLAILLDEIIYKKYILDDDAYNYVELLLKHKADPNMAFTSKKSNDFFNILMLWNSSHSNVIRIRTIYGDIGKSEEFLKTKFLRLLELLLKYGFNNIDYKKLLTNILYKSTKIIKYHKIDTILCQTMLLIFNCVDINLHLNHNLSYFLDNSILYLGSESFDVNILAKLKLLFECGFSIDIYTLTNDGKHYGVCIKKMITNLVNACNYTQLVPNVRKFIKLFLDYCDNNDHITYIKNNLLPGNQFSKYIDNKNAIMKFIKTTSGYSVNRAIMKNYDILYTLLLVRKVIKDCNIRTLILYKIIPLIY